MARTQYFIAGIAHTTITLIAGFLMSMCLIFSAQAVTVTSVGGNNYQVAFDPISFNITQSGGAASIVFEDFYSSNLSGLGEYVSGFVEVSVNGGATQSLLGNSATGHYFGLNDVDSNDLIVTFHVGFMNTIGNIIAGDSWVVSAFNHVFSSNQLIVPAASTSSLEVFLVNNSLERVSDFGVSAVPVPAALPLFGTGLAILGFMGWRRKRKAS